MVGCAVINCQDYDKYFRKFFENFLSVENKTSTWENEFSKGGRQLGSRTVVQSAVEQSGSWAVDRETAKVKREGASNIEYRILNVEYRMSNIGQGTSSNIEQGTSNVECRTRTSNQKPATSNQKPATRNQQLISPVSTVLLRLCSATFADAYSACQVRFVQYPPAGSSRNLRHPVRDY